MPETSLSQRRTSKKRAAKACAICRSRKVRCDLIVRGSPCTNCALDNIECTESPSKRKKTGTDEDPISTLLDLATQGTPENITDTGPKILPSVHSLGSTSCSPAVSNPKATFNSSLGIQDIDSDIEDYDQDHISAQALGGAQHTHNSVTEPRIDRTTDAPQSGLPNFAPPGQSRNVIEVGLPFIRPIWSQRASRHANYLQGCGAFLLPPTKLRNALLESYFQYIHPLLPIVDIHEILESVALDGQGDRVSMLLFQAILLAASAFVKEQDIFDAGYEHRTHLRKELGERVRMLYDFDCETDRFCLVQVLILMTYWQENPSEVKHLWHWIGIAHTLAVRMGLDRNPERSSIPNLKSKMWKRVWWSCYIRDRTLALGLRQSPRTFIDCQNYPALEVQDFDIKDPSSAVSDLFPSCKALTDIEQQRWWAQLCISQIQLCHILPEIFDARYSSLVPTLTRSQEVSGVTVPEPPSFEPQKIQECDRKLDTWFNNFPREVVYKAPGSFYFAANQNLLVLHGSMVNMFYYALICALHRPNSASLLRGISPSEVASQRKSRHAATTITSILGDLQISEMTTLMPSWGMTSLLQAAVTHLCDCQASNAYLRSQSRHQFEACIGFLGDIQHVHAYGAYAIKYLTSAAKRTYDGPNTPQSTIHDSGEPNQNVALSSTMVPFNLACEPDFSSQHALPSAIPMPVDQFDADLGGQQFWLEGTEVYETLDFNMDMDFVMNPEEAYSLSLP